MKNKTKLQLAIAFSTAVMSAMLWSGDRISDVRNFGDRNSGAQSQDSRISGNATINLNVGKINNILTNSSNSQGRVNIGQIKHSNSSGTVKLIRIQVGEVSNELINTNDSIATVKITSIHNSTIKNANIRVDINKVDNKVTGGRNNRGIINIGTIENSTITGSVKTNITSSGRITNSISGGSGSRSEIGVGSIVSDDPSVYINRKVQAQQYTDYSVWSNDITNYYKDMAKAIQENSIQHEAEVDKQDNMVEKQVEKPTIAEVSGKNQGKQTDYQ